MSKQIAPLSGFPELLPEEQLVFERFLNIVRRNYALYGFVPIETPAVERKSTLVSKGGDEKEIYAISRLASGEGESGDTEMALHFDLTVPLARYVAQYQNRLVFPFRRYQIQKVWRGERAQAGRYREFYQCDIDVIGKGDLAIMHDAEMPAIIYSVFDQFGVGPIRIRINNRKVLDGYLESLGLNKSERAIVFRSIDKIEKVEHSQLVAEIEKETSLTSEQVSEFLRFLSADRPSAETLKLLAEVKENSILIKGLSELRQVVEGVRQLGVPDDSFTIDLSIVRGLDYYTGTVYETTLLEHTELGSVCSGGRYDDLASLFTDEKLPGVGISIGLTRLVVTLLKKGALVPVQSTSAMVLVTAMEEVLMPQYLEIGRVIREAGIATEVILDPNRSFKAQMKYANRKGFRFVIIMGESESNRRCVQVKDMGSSEQLEVKVADLAERIISLV
jgi:histidyl-tRNA synthetase